MRVWEGRRFAVVVEDGYEIADTSDAAAIVALDAEDRVVLVRQRRVAIDGELLELPAGLIDEGEDRWRRRNASSGRRQGCTVGAGGSSRHSGRRRVSSTSA